MGVTIAQGGTLFGRWKAKKPLKVLYIDSEMDEDSVRKRMRLVSKMRFDGKRLKRDRLRNLFYVSRKRSHADTDTFKKDTLEFVEKNDVSLVILDNLTAFTQHDDSARAWEDIHVWIDCLKERGKGCAVLLVHHENKKGDQRGTSATTNAVDNVIHLRSSEPKENDQNASDRRGKKQGDAVTPEAQNAASDSGEQPDDSAMKIEVEVEKGRDIYGVAKQLLTVVISPSTNPPFCKLVGVGGEEETGPLGASVLGQTPAKREYRDEGERDTLMQAVLARLEEGKRVKDIAVKYGISPSWIYGIKGRRKHPSWSASREARETARRERDSRIFERSAREGVRTIAASLKMSLTSVRRIIDAAWTKRIEEAPSFKEGKPPEEIAAELGTGTDAETVGRLMCEIRLRRVPDLWEKHMTVVEIARELGATTTRVEKRCRAIEAAERRSKQRCEDMAKVARLYGEHEHLPDKEIIRMTVLPRRTVIVELNRLDPSRRKPKRNPPPVPSAPSDPPAPPPAPG
jgi:Mor family transcriptional regulator